MINRDKIKETILSRNDLSPEMVDNLLDYYNIKRGDTI